MTNNEFHDLLYDFYAKNARILPWRIPEDDGSFDTYKILVSEIMLQQTQVDRVRPKYEAFIVQYPTIQSLATARFQDVLLLWSGLGYNRRAKYLYDFAQNNANGKMPSTIEGLVAHKGIGVNTAAAVLVYSYNYPFLFIETNIRTVLLHHFFSSSRVVDDKQILIKLSQIIDNTNSREFYWALMDYGAHLKKRGFSHLQKISTHKKQTIFKGSTRQLRGEIIRYIAHRHHPVAEKELIDFIQDERCQTVVATLISDGLITKENKQIRIT